MNQLIYIDRQTKKKQQEKIYKETAIQVLYGDSLWNRLIQKFISPFAIHSSLFSRLYGLFQKMNSSSKKIIPFIQTFDVDASEFLDPVSSFRSFNDFFIRKLKTEVRPIDPHSTTAVIPADGRYYFYQDIEKADGFIVKGKKFDLAELIGSESVAKEYEGGSMVIARLCPSDYHRFHFPCDCIPGPTRLINGLLHSVNPIAVKKNIGILSQNKRTVCELDTLHFGRVLYIEIGAINVGSIRQTYRANDPQKKGDEKGYFEFGGSSLIVLFRRDSIVFDRDLTDATKEGYEIRCLMGQSMGRAVEAGFSH
jgi:phosphatidylserine decarboxylase